MTRIPRARKKGKRWLFPLILCLVLLTATGVILYRVPPSLQDIGRIVQSAVGNIFTFSAGPSPAEPLLRGTIYDAHFNELAVSYRLFSLSVHPAEVSDRPRVAQELAKITGEKEDGLLEQLKSTRRTLEVADNLDEHQAGQINALQLKGVHCNAVEARFYPAHTSASHVLGFMGDGVGLAGIEGKYDSVLRKGQFRKNDIPDIDFGGQESLGLLSADLILTLRLDLQKQLENRFREYLALQGAEKGMGLLIEPSSGRILALVNQPGFNPNYFWQSEEKDRVNRIYNHVLDQQLIRPILARAAAIQREGLEGTGLLPETIAAPEYGFTGEMLDAFEQQVQLYASVLDNWEAGPGPTEAAGAGSGDASVVTGVQVGVTLASLVNGGWRISPYVVDSLYDHATAKRYGRSGDATRKSHVLDPALGVKIRRELFSKWQGTADDVVVFTADRLQRSEEHGMARYSTQELFVGLVPAKQPRYLLMMAVENDQLHPLPAESDKGLAALRGIGKELLTVFLKEQESSEAQAAVPSRKKPENLNQFYISKRLNFREDSAAVAVTTRAVAMPQLRGMSLRKGLQRLNNRKLSVRINGSGRIVAQYPLPGVTLRGVNECILTLETRK